MNKRCISQTALDLVKMFGVRNQDKTILNEKAIDAVDKELSKVLRSLRKMRPRGGIVLVESGNAEITAYALNSYKR
jgi:hypothetical protein